MHSEVVLTCTWWIRIRIILPLAKIHDRKAIAPTDNHDRTATTGQPRENSNLMTTMTKRPPRNIHDRTTTKGQPQRNNRHRTARTGHNDRNATMTERPPMESYDRWPPQETCDRTATTDQVCQSSQQSSHNRTTMTKQPPRDSNNRTVTRG
jgi:hypothetical protein